LKDLIRHSALFFTVLYATVTLMVSVVHHHTPDFHVNDDNVSFEQADIFCQICYTFQSQDTIEPEIGSIVLSFECFITEADSLTKPIQSLTHFSNRAPPQLV
jgi:hypothetical protein